MSSSTKLFSTDAEIDQAELLFQNLEIDPNSKAFTDNYRKLVSCTLLIVKDLLSKKQTIKASKYLVRAFIIKTQFSHLNYNFNRELDLIRHALKVGDLEDHAIASCIPVVAFFAGSRTIPVSFVLEADESNPHIASYVAERTQFEKANRQDLVLLYLGQLIDSLLKEDVIDLTALAYLESEQGRYYFHFSLPSFAMASFKMAHHFYDLKRSESTLTIIEKNNYLTILYYDASRYTEILNTGALNKQKGDLFAKEFFSLFEVIEKLLSEGSTLPVVKQNHLFIPVLEVYCYAINKFLEYSDYRRACKTIGYLEKSLKENKKNCQFQLPLIQQLLLRELSHKDNDANEFLKTYDRMNAISEKILSEEKIPNAEEKKLAEDKLAAVTEKNLREMSQFTTTRTEMGLILESLKNRINEADNLFVKLMPFYKTKDDAKRKLAPLKALMPPLNGEYAKLAKEINQAKNSQSLEKYHPLLSELQNKVEQAFKEISSKYDSLAKNKVGEDKAKLIQEAKKQDAWRNKEEKEQAAAEAKEALRIKQEQARKEAAAKEALRIQQEKERQKAEALKQLEDARVAAEKAKEDKRQHDINLHVESLVKNMFASFANAGRIMPYFSQSKEASAEPSSALSTNTVRKLS